MKLKIFLYVLSAYFFLYAIVKYYLLAEQTELWWVILLGALTVPAFIFWLAHRRKAHG